MPVHAPGKKLLHDIPLKFVRDKVSGGGKKSLNAPLNLVSFIDFLVTMVVFLLTSFSASGELLSVQRNVHMPEAANVSTLEPCPIVAISPEVVTLDGRRMVDTPTLAANAALERIDQLVQELETQRRNWGILHPRQPFPGTVVIQADRNIDFRVVKKVMFSAAQAGYANISFAVHRRERQGGGGGGAGGGGGHH